jgi:mRNA interferase RelE/StbE
MIFRVFVEKRVQKKIDKLSERDKLRICKCLRNLSEDPFSGKKLHGEHQNEYSMRVWPYRIIYKIYKNELLVLVIEFGHRQGIY